MTGIVEHATVNGSTPLAGHQVVLHAVTLESGQPVDSSTTDATGRYNLVANAADTAATYLVSVQYDGVAYFSQPLSPGDRSADAASSLTVYDTSYTEPRVFLLARNMIVRSASRDGSRRVIELLTLRNPGTLTRIARDTSGPVWEGALPGEAMHVQIGDADVSPEAVYLRSGTIAVAAPIPPGQKQILVTYLLPGGAREVSLPLSGYVDRLDVLFEDSTASVAGSEFSFVGVDDIGEARFFRYGAGGLDSGVTVTLTLPRPPFSPQRAVWIVVVTMAIALFVGFWMWQRKRAVPDTAGVSHRSDTLASEIAALDKEFEAKGDRVSATERADFERRRAELKDELAIELAREGGAK